MYTIDGLNHITSKPKHSTFHNGKINQKIEINNQLRSKNNEPQIRGRNNKPVRSIGKVKYLS